jgi:hypothetical protein
MRVWVDGKELEVKHRIQIEYPNREIVSGKTVAEYYPNTELRAEHVHVFWNINRRPEILFRQFEGFSCYSAGGDAAGT